MLSRLVITFLPRSNCLLISWLQSASAVILEPRKIKSDTVSTVPPSISHEAMGPDAMILVSECWALSQLFHFLFYFHQQALRFFFTFCCKGGVICISEVINISHGSLVSSFYSCSLAFCIMYSAYKLNKCEYTSLMYSFPNLEPFHCSMPGSNCCFLTCIQISQEAGQVIWYSHLLKYFPQFIVIHTVKGFGIVSKQK